MLFFFQLPQNSSNFAVCVSQYRSLVASLCLPRDLVCFDKNAVDTNNHIKYMDCISGQNRSAE